MSLPNNHLSFSSTTSEPTVNTAPKQGGFNPQMSVWDEVERRSGPDFFRQLPEVQENATEAVKNLARAQTRAN